MKGRPDETRPRTVEQSTIRRGGETPARWSFVERTVWNERMLNALETGVQGGKWHSLIDKVYRLRHLWAAWEKVRGNRGSGGVDGMTIATFDREARERLPQIAEALRSGRYKPSPVRRTHIPKPGSREKRPLGIPTIIDRIVQTAVRNVIEPIFEREFEKSSYGFRPNLGCHDALQEVERLLAAGYVHVVDVDIRKYFDSIPFDGLMAEVAKRVADGRILDLIESYLHQGVLEEMNLWHPEKGTPQGAVISPLLANIYLHPIDVAIREAGFAMVRYADDMVILCSTRTEAEAALDLLRNLLEQRGLELHPEKTRIAHLMERPGFQFLGYQFYSKYRDPRDSSQQKLRGTIKSKTKLTRSGSIEEIIKEINASARGWFTYFQYCSPNSWAWKAIDGYIRFRLRAILEKRKKVKKRRRGRGLAHVKWPNHYFSELGLFSLTDAPKLVRRH